MFGECGYVNDGLRAGVIKFTDSVIDECSEEHLEVSAQHLMAAHRISQSDLIILVYRRLLLLARFCCCQKSARSNADANNEEPVGSSEAPVGSSEAPVGSSEALPVFQIAIFEENKISERQK